MTQYARLDSLILKRLGSAPTGFTQIRNNYHVESELIHLVQLTGRDAFRILDGRLTALKRAKKVRFVSSDAGRGWINTGASHD